MTRDHDVRPVMTDCGEIAGGDDGCDEDGAGGMPAVPSGFCRTRQWGMIVEEQRVSADAALVESEAFVRAMHRRYGGPRSAVMTANTWRAMSDAEREECLRLEARRMAADEALKSASPANGT